MCGTWWWISSGTGRKKRRSVPDDSSTGWACGPASFTTGESAMGASMNTTVGFPVISCADSICVSTGVAGLLFRSHASSKRDIARNASKSSPASCFPTVVPWAGDTSRVSTSDDGMLLLGGGLPTRNYEEGRRGGLEEYPSTYTNGQEVRKTFQGKWTFSVFFGAPQRPCRIPIGDLGGSDPGEHFWGRKPHKHRGRSRPNRGFRLRSFCSPVLA